MRAKLARFAQSARGVGVDDEEQHERTVSDPLAERIGAAILIEQHEVGERLTQEVFGALHAATLAEPREPGNAENLNYETKRPSCFT